MSTGATIAILGALIGVLTLFGAYTTPAPVMVLPFVIASMVAFVVAGVGLFLRR